MGGGIIYDGGGDSSIAVAASIISRGDTFLPPVVLDPAKLPRS